MVSCLVFSFLLFHIPLLHVLRYFSLRLAVFEFSLNVIPGFVSVIVSLKLIVRKDFKHSVSFVGVLFAIFVMKCM